MYPKSSRGILGEGMDAGGERGNEMERGCRRKRERVDRPARLAWISEWLSSIGAIFRTA
jgi:hypothetical protein